MSRPQIFVRGYPVETTQKELEEFFNRVGTVQSIRLMSHFAFITFSSIHYAEKAVEKFDGKRFNGKNLLVQMARQSNRRREEVPVVDKNVCYLCKKEGHWKINCPEFKSKIDPHGPRRWKRKQNSSQSNGRNYRSRKHSQSQSQQKKKKLKNRRQRQKSFSDDQSSSQSSDKSHDQSLSSNYSKQKRDRKKNKSRKHKSSKNHKKSKSHKKNHKNKSKHHSKKHSKKRNYSSSSSSQKSSLNSSSLSKRSSSVTSENKKKRYNKTNEDQKVDNNAEKYYEQKKIDNRIGEKTRTPEKKKERNISVSKSDP